MNANKATLRLFTAIQIEKDWFQKDKNHSKFYERMVKNGYLLDPRIVATEELLDEIEEIVGISGEKANSSFHKSWRVIQDTPQEALWMQAIIHYITTYGFESLGIFQEETVYIPHEKLDLPELEQDLPLVVIKGLTQDGVFDKIFRIGQGIALHENTLMDIMEIVRFNEFYPIFVHEIKNRELKMRLYDYYNIAPTDPEEYLRYLILKLTGESLIIKNSKLIGKIKQSDGYHLDQYIQKAPWNLASIFYRFKPLFLAMKSISGNKRFFNQLRRSAKNIHNPLPEDFLNNITSYIKNHSKDFRKLFWGRLDSASIFRKIRLAQALKFRLQKSNSIVYRVRNGRSWVDDFSWPDERELELRAALKLVIRSIVDNIKENVEGKTIFIPKNIHYTLPATEKQFTGFLPTGSSVSVDEDMIVGIHWFNTKRNRIDLDLSAILTSGKKIGWNLSYLTEEGDVLFSGDMTNAPRPKGASELFYLKREIKDPVLLLVNYYNGCGTELESVPTKILVAKENATKRNFKHNYMVDPNNIVLSSNISMENLQSVIGLLINVDGSNRFYFSNISYGFSNISYGPQSEKMMEYLKNDLLSRLDLREVLEQAGAEVVDIIPEDESIDIDLSPNSLSKDSIINLLQ